MAINQAVIFTKPIHHLELELAPDKLNSLARIFFEQHEFSFVYSKEVSGKELAERSVIKQHYLMYSTAACADQFDVSAEAKSRFKLAFGKTWDEELNGGKIFFYESSTRAEKNQCTSTLQPLERNIWCRENR